MDQVAEGSEMHFASGFLKCFLTAKECRKLTISSSVHSETYSVINHFAPHFSIMVLNLFPVLLTPHYCSNCAPFAAICPPHKQNHFFSCMSIKLHRPQLLLLSSLFISNPHCLTLPFSLCTYICLLIDRSLDRQICVCLSKLGQISLLVKS